MLYRVTYDLETGERHEIAQRAYRNDAQEVIVLDAWEEAPAGYYEVSQDKGAEKAI